jgi:predicted nuclease of predicted toxin-antitoxin system
MKILIDMNLSPTWVNAFAEVKIESVHWSSAGDRAAADSIIMAYAKTMVTLYSRMIWILG